jgi:hypothetical protein
MLWRGASTIVPSSSNGGSIQKRESSTLNTNHSRVLTINLQNSSEGSGDISRRNVHPNRGRRSDRRAAEDAFKFESVHKWIARAPRLSRATRTRVFDNLLTGKYLFICSGVIPMAEAVLRFKKCFLVKDPDGHVMKLAEY